MGLDPSKSEKDGVGRFIERCAGVSGIIRCLGLVSSAPLGRGPQCLCLLLAGKSLPNSQSHCSILEPVADIELIVATAPAMVRIAGVHKSACDHRRLKQPKVVAQ